MNPVRKRELVLRKLNQQIASEKDLRTGPFNDEQIQDLARLNPLKTEDLKAVKGLRQPQIDAYGDLVLDTLQNMAVEVDLASEATIQNTLSELQKKLINLSKRNRLLYLAKAQSRSAIDLYQEDVQPLLDLLFQNQKLELLKIDEHSTTADKVKFRQIQELVSDMRKQQKESGQNDLYIGYPFVMGQFVLDPFTIRAPLALFSIEATITNNSITLSRSENHEILVNTNLLVATQKFTNHYKDLIDPEILEVQAETYFKDLIDLYKQEGLVIELKRPETLIPFQSFNAQDFPAQVAGSFNLEPVMVLGNFPNYATALQRDFSKIMQLEAYPQHVLELLSSVGEADIEAQDGHVVDEASITYQEDDVVNISQLNASQEKALMLVKKGQNLVIEGPPGTGKSQTITNIIASALDQKKNILMVSEKKAAIDVVYSRLGPLNRYALILDNMNDKSRFYNQLLTLFTNPATAQEAPSELKLNHSLSGLYQELDKLSELLTRRVEGTTLIDLYQWVVPLEYETEEGFVTYDFFKKNVKSSFLALPILQVREEIKALLGESDLKTRNLLVGLRHQHPFLSKLRRTLTAYEIKTSIEQLTHLRAQQEAFEQKSLLSKLFMRNPLKVEAQPVIDQLFEGAIDPIDVLRLSHVVELVLEHYDLWLNLAPNHSQRAIEWSAQIETIQNHFELSFEQAAHQLLNFLGFEKINTFEHQHRALIQTINDFNQIVSSIKATSAEKEDVIQERLLQQLISSIETMNQSRRTKEIQRIIERKRKWAVSKFIDTFYVELFAGIKIWLCTPEVVSAIFPLKPDLFDVLIYDEASQIYIEKAIGSLVRSKQVIVAGDSQQLRPSALGFGRFDYADEAIDDFIETTAALDEESLLDLARFKFDSTVLNYHYRSQYEELIAFSNVVFYRDQLIIAPNQHRSSTPPIEVLKVENGLWENRRNQSEAQRVVQLVDHLLKTRPAQETIGVITFNVSQQNLISDLLNQQAIDDPEFGALYQKESNRIEDGEDQSLFVKNIENVQGDERDIIIFSITYAKNSEGRVGTNFGWLNQQGGQNRLNVAITRSKKKIYLVTSIEPFELQVDGSKNQGPKIFRDYLSYGYAVSNQDYQQVKTLFKRYGQLEPTTQPATSDPLIRRLINDITQAGYTCDENIGLGQFTISVAIAKDDEYRLALEFDTEVYRENNTRIRDVYQGTYLTVRNWPLKRIFSRDLYSDYEKTLASILERLEQA